MTHQIHPSRPTHALLLRRPRSDQLRTGHWNARALTGTCAGWKAICADGSARSFTAILADQRRQKSGVAGLTQTEVQEACWGLKVRKRRHPSTVIGCPPFRNYRRATVEVEALSPRRS